MWRRDPHLPSPLQVSAFLPWLPHQSPGSAVRPPCAKLAATAGASSPAAREDESSLFHKLKKLNCAFLAEGL